ncbi:hypothetical protein T459_01641 [Capsicum annuum]|uniref:Uncharacterized protein n=1 Tax=Capsicum annuum TaxID=4072 RepID=A0A2G3AHP7_CAPAN|nr:hypothetical protein T459_01641 [Capsicum annuum]
MQPELSSELEHVANVISQAEGHEEELVSFIKTVHAEHVVHVISAAVHGTSYLRRVLPVGVIVGCSLAALRKFLMYMPKKSPVCKLKEQLIQKNQIENLLRLELLRQPSDHHIACPSTGKINIKVGRLILFRAGCNN